MDITVDSAKKIHQEFTEKKLIYGIKDPHLEIKFMKSYIWVYLLLIVLSILLSWNVLSAVIILNKIKIVVVMVAIFLTIYTFLSNNCKVYFDNNTLILENRLKKKKTIDITKYPKIYTRYKRYTYYNSRESLKKVDSYYLYIEEKNSEIVFNVQDCGSKKILLLINNFKIKNKEDCTILEWNFSTNEEEKDISRYSEFLDNQERIIGVRETKNSMRIVKSSSILFNFLVLVFIACFTLTIYLIFIQMIDIAIWIGLFLVVLIFVLKQEWESLFLKIYYPSEGIIKINKYCLNYTNNNIMLCIKDILIPTSYRKHNYSLIIVSEKEVHTIELDFAQEKQICDFIDNLIFEKKLEKIS